jgi:hypothetical protein
MKVSIIHTERRCTQQIGLDVVSEFRRLACESAMPARLLPTHRHELSLPMGVLLCFVASACVKQHGPAPLAIELEAEEGEQLADGIVRAFELDPPPAYYTEEGIEQLKRCDSPIALAGDRQQWGVVHLTIEPTRDVLVAIAHPPRTRPVQL